MDTGQLAALNEDGKQFPIPTFNRVIIEPMDEEYSGQIIIPEGVKGKPSQGRIIAVGAGRRTPDGNRISIEFSPGQIVVFKLYSGDEIKFNGVTYLLVEEDNILAVLS